MWLKEQKNAELLLGNHEDMMRKCDFLFSPDALELMRKLDNNQRVNLGIWMANGAEDTVRGLFEVSQEEPVQDGFSRWQGVCADPQRTARFRAAKVP